jgi:hypothetical protein
MRFSRDVPFGGSKRGPKESSISKNAEKERSSLVVESNHESAENRATSKPANLLEKKCFGVIGRVDKKNAEIDSNS